MRWYSDLPPQSTDATTTATPVMTPTVPYRHATAFLLLLPLLSAVWQPTLAAPPSLNDRDMAQAAVVIALFDEATRRCQDQGGLKGDDLDSVERWQRDHQVALVRRHLGTFREDPEARLLADLRKNAQRQMNELSDDQQCRAAVMMARRPEAQFATVAPKLLQSLAGQVTAPAAGGKEPIKPAKAPAGAGAAVVGTAASQAAKVLGFGFDTCMRMGVGGALWPTPCPVLLMRDGSATKAMAALADPAGLEAHRQSNPKDWTTWRRDGDRVQLNKSKGWDDITYKVMYQALPANFRLEGRYRSLSGGGNTAVGGTASVAAWRTYQFGRDGRVLRGGGAGGSNQAGGSSVVTSSSSADQRGSYSVEGLTLVIQYDDGSSERRVIVADPKDPKTAIWLDGVGFTIQRD